MPCVLELAWAADAGRAPWAEVFAPALLDCHHRLAVSSDSSELLPTAQSNALTASQCRPRSADGLHGLARCTGCTGLHGPARAGTQHGLFFEQRATAVQLVRPSVCQSFLELMVARRAAARPSLRRLRAPPAVRTTRQSVPRELRCGTSRLTILPEHQALRSPALR